jgi:hypothetical protein
MRAHRTSHIAQYGYTALHRAALYGKLECVRSLLEHGASTDAEAEARQPEAQRAVVAARSVDRATVAQGGYTPLHYVAQYGHTECVSLLLQWGARVEALTTVRCACAPAMHRCLAAPVLRCPAPPPR